MISRLLQLAKSWDQIALDGLWRLSRDHVSRMEPSWPVAPELLERLRIQWPTRYQWPQASIWVVNLLAGLRKHVRVEPAEIPQPYERIVLVQFLSDGRTHDVVIDYSDYMDEINEEGARRALVYFKMHFRKGGYGNDRIVPGGYFNYSPDAYKYIRRLRSLHERAAPKHDVYGRFGLDFARETRIKAVHMLTAQTQFRYQGGAKTVRYGQSLRETARSKIAIDLPGNGDFTFRLIDYLSVGICIVGPPHRTELPVPLVDRRHIILCAPDLSDLVSLCQQYLEDDTARRQVARNVREYFDRYLHRDQLSSFYLLQFFQKLNSLN